MFEVLLLMLHIGIRDLCTAGTYDFEGPRLMCYSYVFSSITSLPI
jgi:hypothetical protein